VSNDVGAKKNRRPEGCIYETGYLVLANINTELILMLLFQS